MTLEIFSKRDWRVGEGVKTVSRIHYYIIIFWPEIIIEGDSFVAVFKLQCLLPVLDPEWSLYICKFLSFLKGKLFYGVKKKKSDRPENGIKNNGELCGGGRRGTKRCEEGENYEEKDHGEHFISLTQRYVYLWQITDVPGERDRGRAAKKGVRDKAAGPTRDLFATLYVFFFFFLLFS